MDKEYADRFNQLDADIASLERVPVYGKMAAPALYNIRNLLGRMARDIAEMKNANR
mgnify:CR=1 FL=1